MIEVQVADIRAQIADFLTKVGDGETVLIKSDGRTVARFVAEPPSEASSEQERAFRAIDDIKRTGGGIPGTTIDEILAWRHEGHDR